MSQFGQLIDRYEETAELFKITRARDLFLKKMMSEEDPANEPEIPAPTKQDDATWTAFLEKIEDCQKYSAVIDKENKANQLKKNYSKINFTESIAQMEAELQKICKEQMAVDALVAARKVRQSELLREREEALNITEEASEAVVDDSIKAESIRLSALLAGLEGLTQFYLANVSHNAVTGDLVLKSRVGSCGVVFVLDAARKLCNMTLDCEGMSINAADVLLEAQQLPAPQDLRYAVFHIGAAQHAPALVKNDVAELRKKNIVQADTKNNSVFHITFSNGVTVQVSTHPCYSYVPNSVHIDKISGIGGWGADELEMAKAETNTKSATSLPEAIKYLLRLLDSK